MCAHVVSLLSNIIYLLWLGHINVKKGEVLSLLVHITSVKSGTTIMPGEVKAGEMTKETNLSQILNDGFRGEQKATYQIA